jgi:hypothetical protein
VVVADAGVSNNPDLAKVVAAVAVGLPNKPDLIGVVPVAADPDATGVVVVAADAADAPLPSNPDAT